MADIDFSKLDELSNSMQAVDQLAQSTNKKADAKLNKKIKSEKLSQQVYKKYQQRGKSVQLSKVKALKTSKDIKTTKESKDLMLLLADMVTKCTSDTAFYSQIEKNIQVLTDKG